MDKILAFGYYGGKYSHLEWLLPLLPTSGITHYCEPFAGSAAVLINRPPAPVETYNDLDGEAVNFFRILRNQREALFELLCLTPYSRTEFNLNFDDVDRTDLERARLFYVRIRQSFGQVPYATKGRWGYTLLHSRKDMGGAVSRFYSSLGDLGAIAERLIRVQIEHDSALAIINRYESDETLFYCDPPYTPDSCFVSSSYQHDMTLEDHRELVERLKTCKGKVALSGFENPLYETLLKDWYLSKSPTTITQMSSGKTQVECLWTNYDPATVQNDMTGLPLFRGDKLYKPAGG